MRQRGMVSPYESFISCRNRRFENCSSGRYSVISPCCGFCLFKQQPLAKSLDNRSGNNELLMIFHTGHFCHFSGSLFSSRSCAFAGICGDVSFVSLCESTFWRLEELFITLSIRFLCLIDLLILEVMNKKN